MIAGKLVALNIRCIPANIRRLFKSRCAAQGITMEDAIVAFMESVVLGEVQIGEDVQAVLDSVSRRRRSR